MMNEYDHSAFCQLMEEIESIDDGVLAVDWDLMEVHYTSGRVVKLEDDIYED